jgi:hypothetical protein
MPPRLLIVNCASPYFFYIPMGSFGLCDFLAQQGVEARIFSPSLYPEAESRQRLREALERHRPTHVGLVCHWQETAHGLLAAVDTVRDWSSEVVTLCGGFTGAYFAEELLRTVAGLDYVVTGDPEEPVAQLLAGVPAPDIANLVWRGQDGTICRSDRQWLMDGALLDQLCFTDLSVLDDGPRYLDKITAKLGFPLLLGRGCVFDCSYCGGSRHAFRLHSGRQRPVTRSLAAVLADLHRLKPWTSVLYLCYENDPAYIKALFQAIADDPELCGHFICHYGAWHLLDAEFLDLYRRAFSCTTRTPIFEFSPEVVEDAHRAAIKRGTTYTLARMEDNFRAIATAFEGQVRIEVFFSRYHPGLTAADLQREVRAILRFKHRLVCEDLPVHVCFDHLSTDVGSRYWQEHQDRPHDFARFLDLKARVDQGTLHPFPVDNLCLLIPDHLDQPFVLRLEGLLLVLAQMERFCRELLHLLLAWYGERWLDDLETMLEPLLQSGTPLNGWWDNPPLDGLLAELCQRLQENPATPPPFLADLFRFSRKKLEQGRDATPCPTERPGGDWVMLDRDRISVHEQDYLDLVPLLQQIHAGRRDRLPYRRTVCLFLDRGILTLAHGAYRATLQPFEQPKSLAAHQAGLSGSEGEQQGRLLAQLVREGVLLPVACP